MKKSQTIVKILSIVVALLLIATAFFLFYSEKNGTPRCKGAKCPTERAESIPYGQVTLALEEFARFDAIIVRPIRVASDSRCPSDLTCVWEGTVTTEIELTPAGATTTLKTLELGKTINISNHSVTLKAVTPYPASNLEIKPNQYRLQFEVVKNEIK